MATKFRKLPDINPNPLAFEELVTSLASLLSLAGSGDLGMPTKEFEMLYRTALKKPPSYSEVTELAGQGLHAGDRRSGRGAWLLMNIEGLQVYGVHSKLWNCTKGKVSAPLLDQIAAILNEESKLSPNDLQRLGNDSSVLDVFGVKNGVVWLVQTGWETDLIDSAVTGSARLGDRLFRGAVFNAPELKGPSLETLYTADDLVRRAFPTVQVRTLYLVLHKSSADFELYHVALPRSRKRQTSITLTESMIRKNSLDYADKLQECDHEILWTLTTPVDDALFRGIPPCRGGRTLGILASMASRQLRQSDLMMWKEKRFLEVMKEDFSYELPRDKVRHDLVDRLTTQGFLRKWGSDYFLTVKGIARYHYCLAKYTTKGLSEPIEVLEACQLHRNKIVDRIGCL